MNILNYEAIEVKDLAEIIEKQREIMFAFEPNLKKRVEEFDIDIYEDQMLLKEFLLERTIEEITEAYAAFRAQHYEHYLEEIVDVFNFLIETHILLENVVVNSKDHLSTIYDLFKFYEKHTELSIHLYDVENRVDPINICQDKIKPDLFDIVPYIGELTNLLKQRPWRESQYPVDLLTFKNRWCDLLNVFLLTLIRQGIGFDILSNIWSKKYQVNKFRIDSNY